MRVNIKFSAVTTLGAALLAALGGSGCASPDNQARITNNHYMATAVVGAARENPGHYPTWRFPRGSAVSPLGDAPNESDLGLMGEISAQPRVKSPDSGFSVVQAASPH